MSDSPVVPTPVSTMLTRGLEVRAELRLAALAAVVTAGSEPVPGEHALVTTTRDALAPYRDHPSLLALKAAIDRTWILSVAMQTVQLGAPPSFETPAIEDIPAFVQRDFPEPQASELAPHFAALWRDAQLGPLFAQQVPLWTEVVHETAEVLRPFDIVGFEEQFFGVYPYHPVVVPLTNLVPNGPHGVGVANQHETYSVCFRIPPDERGRAATFLTELAQHEASHPVLELIVERFPSVVEESAFVEERYPSSERFAGIYDTFGSRWSETLVRASTWFFFDSLGRHDDAEEHIRRHLGRGAGMIALFVEALKPWWAEHQAGHAPGLDQTLGQFPEWLRAAQARLEA